MNTQLKKGTLELCVLALLARSDMYGYELVSRISQDIHISEGTIYPLLKRIKDDGYVTTYLSESSEGPPRKYYSLTPEGSAMKKVLHVQWNNFVQSVNNLLD